MTDKTIDNDQNDTLAEETQKHESPLHKLKKTMSPKPDYQKMVTELVADLQRIQADFVNYRRRSEEEKIQSINLGKEQALLSLIPVVDNIERAIAHEPPDIKDHAWVKGITAVAKQLEDQMQAAGLIKIGIVGEEFDPHKHDAVGVDDKDGDTEVIAEVLQPGYRFGETILRPAMVKITKVNNKEK